MSRRFPPAWSVDENEESFVIKDPSGKALAHISSRITTAAALS